MSPSDAFLIPVHPVLRNVFEISPLISCKTLVVCNIIKNSGIKGLKQALLLGLTLLLLGDRQNANSSISFFLPELFKTLTAPVAHQALLCGFYSCSIAPKLDFAEAKVGSSHQTKPKIISRMSHHEGKEAGREKKELMEREIQTARWLGAWGRTTSAPADGVRSKTLCLEGSRGARRVCQN